MLAFGYIDIEDCPWFLSQDEEWEDEETQGEPDPNVTEDDLF